VRPFTRSDLVIAGLTALLILAGAVTWVEWPPSTDVPRPTADQFDEVLHDTGYIGVSVQRAADRDVLVTGGIPADHPPTIRISVWHHWVDADRAVGVAGDRRLPVGSCRIARAPPRATCVVAERSTASTAGSQAATLRRLRHLADLLRRAGIPGAGPWDGRTR
jgi:hypothetical protein